MATLNVKSFPDELYQRLRALAEREHRSVAQQVVQLVEAATAGAPARSLLELSGLGRQVWDGVEAAEHIATERDAWD